MAMTAASIDTCLCEFCEALPKAFRHYDDLTLRALTDACVYEWNQGLIHRMEHPLLRLSRLHRRGDMIAQDQLLAEANAFLFRAGIHSEDEDPANFPNSNAYLHQSEVGEAAGLNFRGPQLEWMVLNFDASIRQKHVETGAK
ncbi:MAG: hypothetical protein RLY20_3215 [Verrucomicrobiota bacterium]